jgi:hypothetical protein
MSVKISLEADMDAVFQNAMASVRKTSSVMVHGLGIEVWSRLRLIRE